MHTNTEPSNQRLNFAAVLFLLFALASGACVRADEVDNMVTLQLAQQHIPGAAIAVIKSGKLIKAAGYGLANVSQAIPVTTDTVFRLQSLSKQFVAAGIMILVQERKVGLDDPVSRYLNGSPQTWQKLTVRHLLTQTSGLKDFINDPTINLRLDYTDEQLLESAAARPLKFEPGEAWDYSNTNYQLLATIIGKVSGQSYGDFLAERIFKPLSMTRTEVLNDHERSPDTATGYAMEKGSLVLGSFIAPSICSAGSGGIRSTVVDLAKWDAVLYTDQILKRETLEQMWTPTTLNNGNTHPYGFGWEIAEIAKHRRIWHGGKFNGFTTQLDRFVDDQLTVIVLTNLFGSNTGKITRGIAGIYLPAVAAPVYKPIEDKEPRVTARFVAVLRGSAEGGLRSDDFTPAVWEYITSHADQMRRDMAALGPIQKLLLVERTEQDGNRSYRYRARFKRTTLIFHFVLSNEDRISVMMPDPQND